LIYHTNKKCFFGCQSCFCIFPNMNHLLWIKLRKYLPRLNSPHSQEGMKFAAKTSPLLNLKNWLLDYHCCIIAIVLSLSTICFFCFFVFLKLLSHFFQSFDFWHDSFWESVRQFLEAGFTFLPMF
jgi:Trk-type K+ transport system membrane component